CLRAASHSSCDTIEGVFIAISSFGCSVFLSFPAAISFLLCLLGYTETASSEKSSPLGDAYRQNSSCSLDRRPMEPARKPLAPSFAKAQTTAPPIPPAAP